MDPIHGLLAECLTAKLDEQRYWRMMDDAKNVWEKARSITETAEKAIIDALEKNGSRAIVMADGTVCVVMRNDAYSRPTLSMARYAAGTGILIG